MAADWFYLVGVCVRLTAGDAKFALHIGKKGIFFLLGNLVTFANMAYKSRHTLSNINGNTCLGYL